MPPTAIDCHHDCRPTKISPAFRMPIVATPMAMPSGRPAPPEKATPPRIAAVSTSSSKRAPMVGVMLPSRPGDQHRDKSDQQPVDGVEADDRSADRNAAEFRSTRIAADRVDAQTRHRAVRTNEPMMKIATAMITVYWMPKILPRPSSKKRFGKAVDRGAADDEGEPAVERQHRQRHDERRDAELAHQDAVREGRAGSRDPVRRQRREAASCVATATLATMMPISAIMLPMERST